MADYRKGDIVEEIMTRPLSLGYHHSYHNSDAIAAEHMIDSLRVLQVMENMPGFLDHLRNLSRIEALDIGSGEGMKSELIANELLAKLRPPKFVQHFLDSDQRQLDMLQSRLATRAVPAMEYRFYPMTLEYLIKLWPSLGIQPDLVTLFHMLYYLPQQADPEQPFYGTIPLLTALMELCDEPPYFIITEGPGQIQNLKWYMRLEFGYGNPVGERTVTKTLDAKGIPYSKPLHVPNRWRVDMNEIPEVLFHEYFEFLLDGNFDCPPITDQHRHAAGVWIQRNAKADHDGFYLDGPDSIIVAGKWLERQG